MLTTNVALIRRFSIPSPTPIQTIAYYRNRALDMALQHRHHRSLMQTPSSLQQNHFPLPVRRKKKPKKNKTNPKPKKIQHENWKPGDAKSFRQLLWFVCFVGFGLLLLDSNVKIHIYAVKPNDDDTEEKHND